MAPYPGSDGLLKLQTQVILAGDAVHKATAWSQRLSSVVILRI